MNGDFDNCTPKDPCRGCTDYASVSVYWKNAQQTEPVLFHRWISAGQGMDLDWEEYRQWHCQQCREWQRLRNSHHE